MWFSPSKSFFSCFVFLPNLGDKQVSCDVVRLREDKIFSVIALPCLFYFVLLYRALLCPALLSIVLHDLVACFVCAWDLWVRPSGLWECSFTYVFWFVRFMSLLFGAVVRSIGNINFPFNWIVFASVSYNLRASHSPIVLKIRTRNFSLAATGIITETRVPLSPSRSQLAALFFNLDTWDMALKLGLFRLNRDVWSVMGTAALFTSGRY